MPARWWTLAPSLAPSDGRSRMSKATAEAMRRRRREPELPPEPSPEEEPGLGERLRGFLGLPDRTVMEPYVPLRRPSPQWEMELERRRFARERGEPLTKPYPPPAYVPRDFEAEEEARVQEARRGALQLGRSIISPTAEEVAEMPDWMKAAIFTPGLGVPAQYLATAARRLAPPLARLAVGEARPALRRAGQLVEGEAGFIRLPKELAPARITKFLTPKLEAERQSVEKLLEPLGVDIGPLAGPHPNQWFIALRFPRGSKAFWDAMEKLKVPEWQKLGIGEDFLAQVQRGEATEHYFTDFASLREFLRNGKYVKPYLIFKRPEGAVEPLYEAAQFKERRPFVPPYFRPYRAPRIESVEQVAAREARMASLRERAAKGEIEGIEIIERPEAALVQPPTAPAARPVVAPEAARMPSALARLPKSTQAELTTDAQRLGVSLDEVAEAWQAIRTENPGSARWIPHLTEDVRDGIVVKPSFPIGEIMAAPKPGRPSPSQIFKVLRPPEAAPGVPARPAAVMGALTKTPVDEARHPIFIKTSDDIGLVLRWEEGNPIVRFAGDPNFEYRVSKGWRPAISQDFQTLNRRGVAIQKRQALGNYETEFKQRLAAQVGVPPVPPAAPPAEAVAPRAAEILPKVAPQPSIAQMPVGWRVQVGKVPIKPGMEEDITGKAMVNWQRKVIVVSDKRFLRDPSVMNEEIAHIRLEELSDTTKALAIADFEKAAGYEPIQIRSQFARREGFGGSYGEYLTDPSSVNPEIAAVFRKYFPEVEARAVVPHLAPVAPERPPVGPAQALPPGEPPPGVAVEKPGLYAEAEQALREAFELRATGGGAPPPPPTGPLGRVQTMWRAPQPGGPGLRARLGEAYASLQEAITDKFARGNALATQAKTEWQRTHGVPMPLEMDFELRAALLQGAPSAGNVHFHEGIRAMRQALGRDIDIDFVNSYLHLKHSIEIERVKGPQRLIAGGVRGAQEAQAGLDEMARTLGPDKFARVEGGATAIKTMLDESLERQVAEGLVARTLADTLKSQYPWYNRIVYLERDLMPYATGGSSRTISVTRADIRRLSEYGSEALRERPLESLSRLMANTEVLIARNRTARALVKDLLAVPETAPLVKKVAATRPVAVQEGETIFRRPPGEIRGTISFMEGGKRQVYEVPAWAERMAKLLATQPQGTVENIGRIANMPFRWVLTQYNPVFFTGNFVFDMITAASTRAIMPWETTVALAKNLRAIFKEDATLKALMKAGADVTGFWGKEPAEMLGANRTLLNPGGWKALLGKPFEAINKFGHAVELAPRRAVAEKALAAGKTMEEATFEFRRATVDFQRGGSAVRQLNNVFLYLNPAVQGSLLPLRALRDKPVARWGVAGLMSVVGGLYAWNRQFPEYADVPAYDKYGKILVMLPSEELDKRGNKVPRYVAVVPLLRELAAFTAPITYLLGRLDGKAPEQVNEFLAAIWPQVNPLSSIGGGVPTVAGSTVMEAARNWDDYFSRPIIPPEFETKPLAEQYNQYTSETARRVGPALGMSPFQVDHFLKTGSLAEIVLGIDAAIRATQEGEDPRIAGLVEELKNIQETLPADEIARARRVLLNSLSVKDRKAVEDMERKPEPRLPVLSSIQRRFYRGQSGQLYRSGLAQAAKAMNLSEKQTREISQRLGQIAEGLFAKEQEIEAQLDAGKLTRLQWREAHKTLGKFYQGSLMSLGLMFPDAAQVLDPKKQAEFRNSVYSLMGKISDTRTKGQLLTAAYRAIPVEELAPGVLAEDAFKARENFVAGLKAADKALLKAELEASMTRTEKQYSQAQETLRPYWELDEKATAQVQAGYPNLNMQAELDRLDAYNAEPNKTAQNGKSYRANASILKKKAHMQEWAKALKKEQDRLRLANPKVETALVDWYNRVPMTERKKKAPALVPSRLR